jgi:hypothetical protein
LNRESLDLLPRRRPVLRQIGPEFALLTSHCKHPTLDLSHKQEG